MNRTPLGLSYQTDDSALQIGDQVIDLMQVDEIKKMKESEPIVQVLSDLISYIKL